MVLGNVGHTERMVLGNVGHTERMVLGNVGTQRCAVSLPPLWGGKGHAQLSSWQHCCFNNAVCLLLLYGMLSLLHEYFY